MHDSVRALVKHKFSGHCGYCGVHENEAGSLLTVDHFRPRTAGGTNALANLVYCCHACNTFKGSYWQPDSEERVLHPTEYEGHIVEGAEGVVAGITATGMFHIQLLRLNRPQLIERRRARRMMSAERFEREELRSRIEELSTEVDSLKSEVERARRFRI